MPDSLQTTPLPQGEAPAPTKMLDSIAESRKCEQRCAEMIEECDRLRAELAKMQAERDQYRKSLLFYLAKESEPPTFTREAVFAAVETEPSLGELLAELKKE